jgi:hypothetical protein
MPHNNMPPYSQLEKNIQLTITDSHDYSKTKNQTIIDTPTMAILINIPDNNNPIIRMMSLLMSKLTSYRIQKQLIKQNFILITQYAVYPNAFEPVAIFELSHQAEHYSNQEILPPFQNNLNGKIRQKLMKILKFHPSIGAIIIIARNAQ